MYIHTYICISSPVVWGFDTEAMKVLQAMQHFDWDGSSSTATSRNSFTTRTAVEGNKYQKLFQEGVMEAREEKDGEEEGKGDGREQGRPATEDERQRIAQEVGLDYSFNLYVVNAKPFACD